MYSVREVSNMQTYWRQKNPSAFFAQYDKLRYTAMESARFTLFAKKNTIKVIVLSPTSANLFQQVFPAHLQVMLRKAAYCLAYSDKSTDKINK